MIAPYLQNLKAALAMGLMMVCVTDPMAAGSSALSELVSPQAAVPVLEDKSVPGPFDQTVASVQALTITKNGSVYAGSFGHGIFQTVDRGGTWLPVGNGVTDPFILSLTTGRDGAVYAGTFRGGVFRSRDGGETWHSVNAGLKRLEVKALISVGDEIYAGTGDGAYRLNNSADRWEVVTKGLDDVLVHALARAADGTLYAGTSGQGVLRFTRHSSGWVRMRHGLKDHEGMIENFIRVLAIDQNQTIFAGTFNGGVFRSTDRGATWRPISRALPNDSIRGILVSDRSVIVATGNGIFKTIDKGKRWIPLNKGLTNRAVQVLMAGGGEVLYAGTSAGVYRSDDGLTWVAVNQGLEAGPPPPPFLFR